MQQFVSVISFLFLFYSAYAQTTIKACFIGNSYTYSNDLPTLISNLATADGNTLIKDQNTPGGYTFELHSTNATSLNKIAANDWDYVILQEQSQLPSFPWLQVTADVLPFAEILCDSIRSANECAIPVFFNTWGRQFGDSQWDSIDTFTEMNQRLYNAYEVMAEDNSGLLSPVGIAFEHIANDGSGDVTFNALYSGDGSHPSIFGSYLAACIFYQQLFETNVMGNTYFPAGITALQASYLQSVASHVLTDVDSIETNFIQPIANFDFTSTGLNVQFENLSEHDFSWLWNFDDGSTSSLENPSHNFATAGTYDITLIAYYCDRSDTIEFQINLNQLGIIEQKNNSLIYPNPSTGEINLVGFEPNEIIEIYSQDGKLLQRFYFESEMKVNLPTGKYLIKSKSGNSILIVI